MNNKFKVEKLVGAFTNTKWHIFLFPTESCNFRCSYCYEDFSEKGRMSKDTVAAVKKLIAKRAAMGELSILLLSWFGGEPLLATDIIRDVCDHVKRLSENTNNFRFLGSMTTNGFLLSKDMAEELVALGNKRYQISLDGTKDMHNKTRSFTNGKGTFDTIWSNLVDIKNSDLDVEIVLRLHLHAHNVEDLAVLIKQIKQEFGNDKRFVIFIKPISPLGGANDSDSDLFLLDNSKKREAVSYLHSLLGDETRTLDLSSDNICYASQPNSIAIRADGSLAKCTVALDDSKNNIGKINSDGTLDIDKSKFILWTRGWLKGADPSSLICPYFNNPDELLCLKQFD